MISGYHVTIEGIGLDVIEGPKGFFANRFVIARSEAAAKIAARRITVRNLTKWLANNKISVELRIVSIEKIGLFDAITRWRQNRGHAFYMAD